MALFYRELGLMNKFDEFDWCMRHKCKVCKLDGECRALNKSHNYRLMWHPFENLPEIMKQKGMSYGYKTR